jgi:hypothetical protein
MIAQIFKPNLFEFVSGEFSYPTFTLELGQVLANFGIARDQIIILENTIWVLQDQHRLHVRRHVRTGHRH